MCSSHTAKDRYWWLRTLPHYDDVSFLENPTCAVVKSLIRSTAEDLPEEFYLACKLEQTVFTAGENVKGKLSVYVDKNFPCQRLDIHLKCICFLSVPKSTAKYKRSAGAIYATANVWTAKGRDQNYHIPYGMSDYVFDLRLPKIVRASTVDHVVSVVYAILVDFHQTRLEAHERLHAFAGYVKVQSQPYIERSIIKGQTSCSDTLIVLDRSGLFLGALHITMSLRSFIIFTKNKTFIQVLIQCENIKTKFKLLEIFPALIQETVLIGEPTRKCQRAIVYLKNDSRNNIARKKREIRHFFEMDVGDIIPTTFPAEQESSHRLQINYFMILLVKHEDYSEYNIVTRQPVTVVHQESCKETTQNCEETVPSLQVKEERKEETPEHPELRKFQFGPSFKNSSMHQFFSVFHVQLEQVLPLLRELNSRLIYVYSFLSLAKTPETCEEWTMINNWLRSYENLLEPTLMGIDNIEGIKKAIQQTISNFYKPWLLETHFSTKPYEVIRSLLKDMINKITEMIHWILIKDHSAEGPQHQPNETSTSDKSLTPIPLNACKLWFGWTTQSPSKQSKSVLVKTFIDEEMIKELNLKNMFSSPSSDLTQAKPLEQGCQFFSLEDSASNVAVTNKTYAKIVSDITGLTTTSKPSSTCVSSGTKASIKTLPAEIQSVNIEPQGLASIARSEAFNPNSKIKDTLDAGTQSVKKRKILRASKKQRSVKKTLQNIPEAPLSNCAVGQTKEKVNINRPDIVASLPKVLIKMNMPKETKNSDNLSKLCQTKEIQNTYENVSPNTRYLKHKTKADPPKSSEVQDMKSTSDENTEIIITSQAKKKTNCTLICQPKVNHSPGSSKCALKNNNSPEYKNKLDMSNPTYNSTPGSKHSFSQTEETVSSVVQTIPMINVELSGHCNMKPSLTHSIQATDDFEVFSGNLTDASGKTIVETVNEPNIEFCNETNPETSSTHSTIIFCETNSVASKELNVETHKEVYVKGSASKMNIEVSGNFNVETSSEANIDMSCENNVQGSSKTNIDMSCENNFPGSSETNIDMSCENNIQGSSKTNIDMSFENNIQGSSKTNSDISCENNIQGSSENNIQGSSKTNSDISCENNIQGSSETNIDMSCENNIQGSSKTNSDISCEYNIQGSGETNINMSCENNIQGSSETNTNMSCENNIQGSSKTNPEISAPILYSDSPEDNIDLSTLTQKDNSCKSFPLLASEAPSALDNKEQTIQFNIIAQGTDSEHVVSSMDNSETESSKESRKKSVIELSARKNYIHKSHVNSNGKSIEPCYKLSLLTGNNYTNLEDLDNVGCSDCTNKSCSSSASKSLLQPETHNCNTENLHSSKSYRSIIDTSSNGNSFNSLTKGVNKSADKLSTKKTKIADRLWTLSRKSHDKSSNLKKVSNKGFSNNCVEQKTSKNSSDESESRHNMNQSIVILAANGMQLKTIEQDTRMIRPVDMATKFHNKLLFEGLTFDGKSQSSQGVTTNSYKYIKTETSAISSEIPLLKDHRLQNPLVVTRTSSQGKGFNQQEIQRMKGHSTNNDLGAIKPGYHAVESLPVTESFQKYKCLVPVPVSKTYPKSQVCINEKHKQLTGLNITKQYLPSEPVQQLYRPVHEVSYSEKLIEPVMWPMDKRGKHLSVPMTRHQKLPAELMAMSTKLMHEPVRRPLKLDAETCLGQTFMPELPNRLQMESGHQSNIPTSLQKFNKVQLRIEQPKLACPVTGGHPSSTNNGMAISDCPVTPPSGRCTPLEELKFFLFGLADESQNKEVNSKGVNESSSQGPFRVPRFEKDEETLWEDSIINNINLQHTGIWSHNVCNMWATNFNYGDSQSISDRPDINKVTSWTKTSDMPQSKLNPAAPAFILSGENMVTKQLLCLNRERQTMTWKSEEQTAPFDLLRVLKVKYDVWVKTKQNAPWDASSLNVLECEITTLCRLLSSQLYNNKTALHLLDYFMKRIHNSNCSVQPVVNSSNYPQSYGHSAIPQFAQENLSMAVYNPQDLLYTKHQIMSNDFYQYPLDSGAYRLDCRPCQVNQVHGNVLNSGQLAMGYIPTLEYQQNPMLPYSRSHL